MLEAKPSANYHVEYMDVFQHWSPSSEQFAGGDALVTLLSKGWKIKKEVQVEKRDLGGNRESMIYHIELERDGQTMSIPVIRNPYVNSVLRRGDYLLIPYRGDQS